MIFHYHPIFGLQYYNYDCDIIIDLAVIPKDFSIEKWMYYAKSSGIYLINSYKSPVQKVKRIYHNLLEI